MFNNNRKLKPAVMAPMGITSRVIQPPALGLHPDGIRLSVMRPNLISPLALQRLKANLPK